MWTWLNDGNEYFYDKSDWIRIRVEEEHWNDISPVAPSERNSETVAERKSPYFLIVRHIALSYVTNAQRYQGSMMQGGLGPVTWWS